MDPLKRCLRWAGWVAYPLVILAGLSFFEPRFVALVLISLLLLRHWSAASRLVGAMPRLQWVVLAALLLLGVLTTLTNSETLLRLYPAAVNLGMLLLFGFTLVSPPSMIERFARLSEPELSPAAIRYTRSVTWVWCGFFVANGAVAAWTAVSASRTAWALYNGLIAYLLMGALFLGEWLVRRRRVEA